MLIIKVDSKKVFEKALKQYKSKIIKTKQLKKLRDLEKYEKTSEKKREKLKKAKYVNKKFGNR